MNVLGTRILILFPLPGYDAFASATRRSPGAGPGHRTLAATLEVAGAPGRFDIDSRVARAEFPGKQMLAYVWVAFGGALGSVARFWFSGMVARRFGETFPWGTLLVNITGSFLIGLFAALTGPDGRWLVPGWFRQQFFMLGICGGYTTFSSFSLQTLHLAQDGQWLQAGANVLFSVAACLVAVWLGHLLATSLNAPAR